jgi:hypothetical protein
MQEFRSNNRINFIKFTMQLPREVCKKRIFAFRLSQQDYRLLVSLSKDCGNINLSKTVRMLIKYANSRD